MLIKDFICVSVATLALLLAAITVTTAQDNWQVLDRRISRGSAGAALHPGAPASSDQKTVSACGEEVIPAAPAIRSIVARIDSLWGVNFPVYLTVAPEPPHASAGGCIFYNPRALESLMTRRLGVNDLKTTGPLVWAIFAHEVGHQVHHDFDASRRSVPNQTKELEADRFAGYTLEELDIPVIDLTPFWDMAGDEFGRGQHSHGTSLMRTAAFKQGWRLAEWGRAEDSAAVAAALQPPVAPDDSAAEPQ